jgi:NADH-quinone oxidoreductase subunit G
VVRILAQDNLDVNDAWLCDKGRFAFAYHDRPDRLLTPLLRVGGLEPVSFAEAFGAIAEWCRGARVGFLAGGRLSDEDAYALSRFARAVVGTNDIDHRPGGLGSAPLDVEARQAQGATVTYEDVERATTVVIAGLDAEQEVPILHLRIRKAVRKGGARVVVVGPRRTRLQDVAEHVLCRPGEEESALTELGERVKQAGEGLVVLAGARLAESAGAVEAAAALAAAAGGRFALVARRAGDAGALAAGVHPALLPFGRRVDDGGARAEVAAVWGAEPPATPGLDTMAILRAAAARELDVLFLIGVDVLRDAPDAALARRALENVRYKVVLDTVDAGLGPFADAMLPAAASVEKEAHYSDWEGRCQRVRAVRDPLGMARPDWQILQELSEAMGADMGFGSVEDVRREMSRIATAPSAAGGSSSHDRTGAGAASTSQPSADGSLVLFTYSMLVDEGRQVEGADRLKEALAEPAFVEIHPDDASALGLADGDRARVATPAAAAELPVRVSDGVVRGAAFLPWNNPGLAANTLLSGSRITAATLTKVDNPVPAEVGAP